MSTTTILSSVSCLAVGAGAVIAAVLVYKHMHKGKGKGKGKGGGGTGGGSKITFKSGSAKKGTKGKCNISYFGQNKADDNGEGFSGVDLFKYQGVAFQGQPVFPCAVHQKHFAAYAYKILRLSSPSFKRSVYLHVLDACDYSDASCSNVSIGGLDFLVDVHFPAAKYVGVKGDDLTTGTYEVVGEIPPYNISADAWIPGVKSGSDSIMCWCKDDCRGSNQMWAPLKGCVAA